MPWDASAGGGFTTGKPWYDFAPGKEQANVAAEANDPASLLSWYRQLIHLRHASNALRTGEIRLLSSADHSTPVLAFVRETQGRAAERVLVVHNLGTTDAEAGPFVVPGESAEALLASAGATATHTPEGWKIVLPAGASGVWRLR
jgi:glycosidase